MKNYFYASLFFIFLNLTTFSQAPNWSWVRGANGNLNDGAFGIGVDATGNTFVTGSYDQPDDIKVYQPVERVFNEKLPDQEKFLSFDRLWDTYENEKPVGEKEYENLWEYFKPDSSLNQAIEQLSIDAYCSVHGTGYGRIDIRMDKDTGKMYVLEVNAQCGLSEDENYTSIGAMVRLGNENFSNMLRAIIENALQTKLKYIKAATLINK